MSKNEEKQVRIANLICALLMMVLVVLQFVPFWTIDGESVSVSSYIWFPSEHQNLTKYFSSVSNDFVINAMVTLPILIYALGIGGFILSLFKGDKLYTAILGIICAIVVFWGYATKPLYRLGAGWVIQPILAVLVLAAAVYAVVSYCRPLFRKYEN